MRPVGEEGGASGRAARARERERGASVPAVPRTSLLPPTSPVHGLLPFPHAMPSLALVIPSPSPSSSAVPCIPAPAAPPSSSSNRAIASRHACVCASRRWRTLARAAPKSPLGAGSERPRSAQLAPQMGQSVSEVEEEEVAGVRASSCARASASARSWSKVELVDGAAESSSLARARARAASDERCGGRVGGGKGERRWAGACGAVPVEEP